MLRTGRGIRLLGFTTGNFSRHQSVGGAMILRRIVGYAVFTVLYLLGVARFHELLSSALWAFVLVVIAYFFILRTLLILIFAKLGLAKAGEG